MKLSLAPLAYYWSREATLQFYAEAMEWPVDTIYLGEVVCSRRHQLRLADWISLAQTCRDAGKEVVLSSLTLIDNEGDRRVLNKLLAAAHAGQFLIEANDYSAVRVAHRLGLPFVAGPHLNVYHEGTLTWLHGLGARRFMPPVELNKDDLAHLQNQAPDGMETEVQVWGRMALAHSSRCFTARHHRLSKDACEFRCDHYPDGLALATREHQDFLTINGIQTQSANCLDLSAQVPELARMGIDVLRLQIQSQDMEHIVHSFDQARRQVQAAHIEPSYLPPHAEKSNGYWTGKPGMRWDSIAIKPL